MGRLTRTQRASCAWRTGGTRYRVEATELRRVDAWVRGSGGAPAPDAACFGAAISACAEAGQWEMALKVTDDPAARCWGREAVASSALVVGCAAREDEMMRRRMIGRPTGRAATGLTR